MTPEEIDKQQMEEHSHWVRMFFDRKRILEEDAEEDE